jgi:hypothetical protein
LPGVVNEGDGCVGRPADVCGQLGEPVEGRLRGSVEDIAGAKRCQTNGVIQHGNVLCHADLSRQYRPTMSFVLGNGRFEGESLALSKIALQQGAGTDTLRLRTHTEMLHLQSTRQELW